MATTSQTRNVCYQVLESLALTGQATIPSLKEALGRSESAIRHAIGVLTKEGAVTRVDIRSYAINEKYRDLWRGEKWPPTR